MPDTKIIDVADTEIVCYCGQVTKGQIINAIKNGDNTFSVTIQFTPKYAKFVLQG